MFDEIKPAGGWYAWYQRKEARARRIQALKEQLKALGLVAILLMAFIITGNLEAM